MKNDTLIRHNGMTLRGRAFLKGEPTRIVRFVTFLKMIESGKIKGPATREAFLRLENRPNRKGYWSDFFRATVATGAVNVTKGPKGAFIYSTLSK
jgi:hypothetical protein